MVVQRELRMAIRRRGRAARYEGSRAARFDRTKDPRGGRTGVPTVTGPGQVWSCPDGVQGVSSGAERPPLRSSGGRGAVRSGAVPSWFSDAWRGVDVRPSRSDESPQTPTRSLPQQICGSGSGTRAHLVAGGTDQPRSILRSRRQGVGTEACWRMLRVGTELERGAPAATNRSGRGAPWTEMYPREFCEPIRGRLGRALVRSSRTGPDLLEQAPYRFRLFVARRCS